MASFRPAVRESDGYIQKIIKYIPAEIIAGYTALVGYLTVGSNAELPPHYKTYYIILLLVLIAITPVWTYFAVIDSQSPHGNQKKRAIFHAAIATVAFIIWVYAIGNILLKAVLCNCHSASCADCGLYSPVFGSILLVLFTLMTPLFERIFLGTKLPVN
ncbi:MAG: hypothetical protein EPN37_05910 [Chitinophagaceae bacterium]|nr:MAG: hypothetical protein EPN37_05910 [Chitinophagaceae bacterium]